jgi:dUTP pyrophosphatase
MAVAAILKEIGEGWNELISGIYHEPVKFALMAMVIFLWSFPMWYAIFHPKNVLRVKRLGDHATVPTRGSKGAAGWDLYASQFTTIPLGGAHTVSTDIAVSLPPGCYLRIAPRSSLAAKNGISVGAGVVDSDYRGPIKVVLFNHGDRAFQVHPGDRIAQCILEKYVHDARVQEVAELDDTKRGAGGFGSTGTN